MNGESSVRKRGTDQNIELRAIIYYIYICPEVTLVNTTTKFPATRLLFKQVLQQGEKPLLLCPSKTS